MNAITTPFLTAATLGLLHVGILRAQPVDTTSRTPTSRAAYLTVPSSHAVNTTERHAHKAALRSAILPGWGQVYNGKAWKLPIVYAVLGTTGSALHNNVRHYKALRYAYKVAYNIQQGKDSIGSATYRLIDRRVQAWLAGNQKVLPTQQLKAARNRARIDASYTAICTALAWALNVVDATVEAHLSSFDVSEDLSMQIQPGYSWLARTAGLRVLLSLK